MALVKITTKEGAIPSSDRERMAAFLSQLTDAAEGFTESNIAPKLTWISIEPRPASAFLTAAGLPSAPLYYVEITTLRDALAEVAKQNWGGQMTQTLLILEGCSSTPDNAARVWIQFTEVADGNLVVGGQTASLEGLRALIA